MNTFVVALVIAVVGTEAASLNGQSGCLYDGKIYAKGAEIRFGNCLGAMTCDGDNSYSNLVQWGGICPEKDSKRENKNGCWFDGKVYAKGEQIVFGNCLGAMTCDGDNSYSNLVQWGNVCPNKDSKRESMDGCYFDGKMYAKGEQIRFGNCLGAMTCDGNNSYSNLVQWGNVCPGN